MQFLVTVEEFRGHRYLDDLRSELGSLDLGQGLLHTPKLLRYDVSGQPAGWRKPARVRGPLAWSMR